MPDTPSEVSLLRVPTRNGAHVSVYNQAANAGAGSTTLLAGSPEDNTIAFTLTNSTPVSIQIPKTELPNGIVTLSEDLVCLCLVLDKALAGDEGEALKEVTIDTVILNGNAAANTSWNATVRQIELSSVSGTGSAWGLIVYPQSEQAIENAKSLTITLSGFDPATEDSGTFPSFSFFTWTYWLKENATTTQKDYGYINVPWTVVPASKQAKAPLPLELSFGTSLYNPLKNNNFTYTNQDISKGNATTYLTPDTYETDNAVENILTLEFDFAVQGDASITASNQTLFILTLLSMDGQAESATQGLSKKSALSDKAFDKLLLSKLTSNSPGWKYQGFRSAGKGVYNCYITFSDGKIVDKTTNRTSSSTHSIYFEIGNIISQLFSDSDATAGGVLPGSTPLCLSWRNIDNYLDGSVYLGILKTPPTPKVALAKYTKGSDINQDVEPLDPVDLVWIADAANGAQLTYSGIQSPISLPGISGYRYLLEHANQSVAADASATEASYQIQALDADKKTVIDSETVEISFLPLEIKEFIATATISENPQNTANGGFQTDFSFSAQLQSAINCTVIPLGDYPSKSNLDVAAITMDPFKGDWTHFFRLEAEGPGGPKSTEFILATANRPAPVIPEILIFGNSYQTVSPKAWVRYPGQAGKITTLADLTGNPNVHPNTNNYKDPATYFSWNDGSIGNIFYTGVTSPDGIATGPITIENATVRWSENDLIWTTENSVAGDNVLSDGYKVMNLKPIRPLSKLGPSGIPLKDNPMKAVLTTRNSPVEYKYYLVDIPYSTDVSKLKIAPQLLANADFIMQAFDEKEITYVGAGQSPLQALGASEPYDVSNFILSEGNAAYLAGSDTSSGGNEVFTTISDSWTQGVPIHNFVCKVSVTDLRNQTKVNSSGSFGIPSSKWNPVTTGALTDSFYFAGERLNDPDNWGFWRGWIDSEGDFHRTYLFDSDLAMGYQSIAAVEPPAPQVNIEQTENES